MNLRFRVKSFRVHPKACPLQAVSETIAMAAEREDAVALKIPHDRAAHVVQQPFDVAGGLLGPGSCECLYRHR